MAGKFQLVSDFGPKGDQPQAIEQLSENVEAGVEHQVLLGVTGSGKTYTIANVIERVQKPTLVIVHNKTLAAQLYSEFKSFFPYNAVEYFVSYYDYYQPEAYIPQTDTYIEKDASINDEIDKMRHAATRSLLERRDVIIVASVSCIYGLGSPELYHGMMVYLEEGERIDRDELLHKLVQIQYRRNDIDFRRGTFRVRGDVVEVMPSHEWESAIRIELFGDEVDAISRIDPLTGAVAEKLPSTTIYPSSHFVTPEQRLKEAIEGIQEELAERVAYFEENGKQLEAQRIQQRTMFDMEMMSEIGYCQGIENYSRWLDGRQAGEPPHTLLDYYPEDSLVVIDESHVAIPQVKGMYLGDQSRKRSLVEYGFRLPSALDNRPLNFEEFQGAVSQLVYVSATPADYELEKSGGLLVEQLIRPTGLTDPEVKIEPSRGQVDHLMGEINKRAGRDQRVLVTTLTKRFSEDLTEYYQDMGLKVRYMHSDIDTLERTEIIRDLRLGKFDALIGINLLREGLDLPEVSLVAILDADKEGFLRSETALIQTMGRAARNVEGEVLLYADKMTNAIKAAISETERRREKQLEFNRMNNITPASVKKSIHGILGSVYERDYYTLPLVAEEVEKYVAEHELPGVIQELEKEMRQAAKELEFEKAAEIRDKIRQLRRAEFGAAVT